MPVSSKVVTEEFQNVLPRSDTGPFHSVYLIKQLDMEMYLSLCGEPRRDSQVKRILLGNIINIAKK
jgi:hypothetical protein